MHVVFRTPDFLCYAFQSAKYATQVLVYSLLPSFLYPGAPFFCAKTK